MTLGEYYYEKDFGNKVVHIKGKRGRFYQDHMLATFAAFRNEVIDEERTHETETDIYVELVPRIKWLWRRIK